MGSGLRVRSGYREEFEVPDLCDSVLSRQLKVCSVKGAGSQFVKIGMVVFLATTAFVTPTTSD